jgi:hypothetical protein
MQKKKILRITTIAGTMNVILKGQLKYINESFDVIGWNMYMTPEQASRGLLLKLNLKEKNIKKINYPDLSLKFKQKNVKI